MENEIHHVLLTLFLVIISARIFGEIFVRLSLPSVLGEIFAGLLLGASFFNIVEPNLVLKILAEMGIILLLFEIGMETDFDKMKHSGNKSIIVALSGIILPLFFGYFTSFYIFNFSTELSLFIAGTITATSIGITLRVFKDIHLEKTEAAQIVIGAAIIDDIIGVILLVFIYDYTSNPNVNYFQTFTMIAGLISFLILAPILAKGLSYLIVLFKGKSQIPGYMTTIIISLILFFSYISHYIGAPSILGAFVAGIALSRRFFLPFGMFLNKKQISIKKTERDLKPIIQLITPIFFVMIGLNIDLSIINFSSKEFWIMTSIFTIVSFASKFSGALLIHQKVKKDNIIIGISMIPRGEVGLIFAELGRISGIIPLDIYTMLVLVIIITTVIPVLILKTFEKKNQL